MQAGAPCCTLRRAALSPITVPTPTPPPALAGPAGLGPEDTEEVLLPALPEFAVHIHTSAWPST